MDSKGFARKLKACGFDFITGVPCSYFSSLICHFDRDPFFTHIPAVREDIAVGLGAGAYLGNSIPIIYMQNSGLGYCLEAFSSLHLIYRIPSLVLLSHRGPDDGNMEEHLIMGKHTLDILTTFNFNHSMAEENAQKAQLDDIKQFLVSRELPYFLVFRKGVFQ